jgi:hypothetical protein
MPSGVPLLLMDTTSMYDEIYHGVNTIYAHLKPKKIAC